MANPWTVSLQRVEGSGSQAATIEVSDSSQEPGTLLLAQKAPTRVILQQEYVLPTCVRVNERILKVLGLSWTPQSPVLGHRFHFSKLSSNTNLDKESALT